MSTKFTVSYLQELSDYALSHRYLPVWGSPYEKSICYIEGIVSSLSLKGIAPTIDGYWVLQSDEPWPDTVVEYARERKVLINPTREDSIQYMPRQTYRCDHMFDEKDDDGCCVVLSQEEFWDKHEAKFQEWLKGVSDGPR